MSENRAAIANTGQIRGEQAGARIVRAARRLATVEGVFLLVLGVAGLVLSWSHPPTTQEPLTILWLRVNLLHSSLYLAAGFAALFGVLAFRLLRWVVVTELVVFATLFVYGTALSEGRPTQTMWNLDTADNVLHGALTVLGVALVTMLFVRELTGLSPAVPRRHGLTSWPEEDPHVGAGQAREKQPRR